MIESLQNTRLCETSVQWQSGKAEPREPRVGGDSTSGRFNPPNKQWPNRFDNAHAQTTLDQRCSISIEDERRTIFKHSTCPNHPKTACSSTASSPAQQLWRRPAEAHRHLQTPRVPRPVQPEHTPDAPCIRRCPRWPALRNRSHRIRRNCLQCLGWILQPHARRQRQTEPAARRLIFDKLLYFHVPSSDVKHPVYPDFANWAFPHDNLPPSWPRAPASDDDALDTDELRAPPSSSTLTAAVLRRDKVCVISGQRDCVE
jgi:hypothetical protein